MSKARTIWEQLDWTRPLEPVAVAALLRHWAADERSPRIALETRLQRGAVNHLLGYEASHSAAATTPLGAMVNVRRRSPRIDRQPTHLSGRLRATTRHRPLRLNDAEAVVRAVYASGLRLKKDETLVLQVVLGPRRIPQAVPTNSPSSIVQPWWSTAWLGDGRTIDGEKRSALRAKVSDHGFACTVRLGVRAADPGRRRSLLRGLLAAIRVSEAPGVQLRLRREPPRRLDRVDAPLFWPLRLSVPELTGLIAWPLGEADLPGAAPAHPKRLAAPAGTTGNERIVADIEGQDGDRALALPAAAALHHLHVIGPTGVGKSTLLANLIIQDIASPDRRSVIVIEPKGDLVHDVLGRIPADRQDDVVVLDPHDRAPVGLNPLHGGNRRPDLVADGLLSVLRGLYGKNIGPRSADILYASLLTLARRHDASLVMLPLLLTNPGIRRSLTTGLHDPLTLEPFWAAYERWSDAERAAAVGPVMNKLRPLLRPGLRGVLGQRFPRFDISRVFERPTILLVPLQRGLMGNEAAGLLGSIVVAELWQAIQRRASVPAQERRPGMVYIDEAQSYLNLPTDLADALAQARGYGVGFTLAHQFLSQFGREMRSAVLANARSRIVFQVGHDDARVLERGHPELVAEDLTSLGKYELYASLFARGHVQPYAFGRSRPLPASTSRPDRLRARSRAQYGQPLDEIEAGFADLVTPPPDEPGSTNRRRRTS